jgi:hypothetical protein
MTPEMLEANHIAMVCFEERLDWPRIMHSGCRWIHGDVRGNPHWSYCQNPVAAPGESWCAEHRARVYVGSRPINLWR